MENATKALIIAGAILIAIILIGIGVGIVGLGQGFVGRGEETMTAQEIQMFNNQFENYTGAKRGSTVKQLMGIVNSSNAANDENHQVKVSGPNKATTTDDIINNIKATTTYTISITSDPDSGLIKEIEITEGGSRNPGNTSVTE